MKAKATPKAQALAFLRAELANLQAHNLAPTHQKSIKRMIERLDELGTVFEAIWNPAHIRPHHERGGLFWLVEPVPGWLECYTPEQFNHEVDLERRRLLQTIIGAADMVPKPKEDMVPKPAADHREALRKRKRKRKTPALVHKLATDRRKALKDLPDLLDDFGKLAKAMATKLEEIQSHAHAGGLSLPGWLSDPVELMTWAAAWYGPDSFDLIARDDLEALAVRYANHLPDLQNLLDFLAITGNKTAHATPLFYEFRRQSNPIGDYARVLLENLAIYWRAAGWLLPFEFTANQLMTLAAVMTDADELNDESIERQMREILREQRG